MKNVLTTVGLILLTQMPTLAHAESCSTMTEYKVYDTKLDSFTVVFEASCLFQNLSTEAQVDACRSAVRKSGDPLHSTSAGQLNVTAAEVSAGHVKSVQLINSATDQFSGSVSDLLLVSLSYNEKGDLVVTAKNKATGETRRALGGNDIAFKLNDIVTATSDSAEGRHYVAGQNENGSRYEIQAAEVSISCVKKSTTPPSTIPDLPGEG